MLVVWALLSATLLQRGCCQPSAPSCQLSFTFKMCQDKEIDGWFCAVGAGPVAWVKVRGQDWLQLTAAGGQILPGLFPAQGFAAARRGGRKEKLWCCSLKRVCLLGIFIAFIYFFSIYLSCCKGNVFSWLLSGEPFFFLSLFHITLGLSPRYFSLASPVPFLSETGVFP